MQMRSLKQRYHGNKLIVETDFAQGRGWHLDLGRGEDSSPSFIVYKYKIERAEVDFVEMFELSD
jgi:hypothetical protein